MTLNYNEEDILPTAVSYKDMAVQIAEMDKAEPELAGELAIAYLTFIHTGGKASTDNDYINSRLESYRAIVEKSTKKYWTEQRRNSVNLIYQRNAELRERIKRQEETVAALENNRRKAAKAQIYKEGQ